MGFRREKVKGFKVGIKQVALKSNPNHAKVKVATHNTYFTIQYFFTERMCFERQNATKLQCQLLCIRKKLLGGSVRNRRKTFSNFDHKVRTARVRRPLNFQYFEVGLTIYSLPKFRSRDW